MEIKQIRNATIRVLYAGKTFLIDPWLAEKGQMGCFLDIPGNPFHVPDAAKEGIPMPMCALPEPAGEILKGVDYYVVTHIHPDHVDMAPDGTVGRMLDKTVPVLVQNEIDGKVFRESGFDTGIAWRDRALRGSLRRYISGKTGKDAVCCRGYGLDDRNQKDAADFYAGCGGIKCLRCGIGRFWTINHE